MAAWLAFVAAPSGHEPAAPVQPQPSAAPQQQISGPPSALPPRALLDRYCVSCHNQRLKTAGLMLDTLDVTRVGEHADVWEKVLRKLRSGMMPPGGAPRADTSVSLNVASALESALDHAARARPRAGRTETFHRLNRIEYQNAIRDLLDLKIDVTSLLPADDASYGFDNIAGVLKLNQSLLENYLVAALKIAREAVGSPLPTPKSQEFRVPDELRQYEHLEGLPFGTGGGILVDYDFQQTGEYLIGVDLLCRVAGCDGSAGFADTHQLEVTIDGERIHVFTFPPHENDDEDVVKGLKVRAAVNAGPRKVGATFLKLPSVEEVESHRQRPLKPYHMNGNFMQQRWAIYQPFVDKLTITGPFNAVGPGDTPSRRRIFACRPARASDEGACARKILSGLARRAFRRPVTDSDVQRLMAFYTEGRSDGSFEAGLELAIRRLLVTPEFLFRIEAEPANLPADTNYRLSDIELASRLSFFLWSSIPDDELIDAAAAGHLKDPAQLERQVRRMLQDTRSRALVDNFVGQWLQTRNLEAHQPSVPLYPDFDDSLREAFHRETHLFVESVLREDRSILELLTANYTFVNERLAVHYGIPNVKGSQFRRVTLDGAHRRGLLGHGSVLTVTSRPNRTSPVLRGKWILENILGTPPPSPPPNVPPFPEQAEGTRNTIATVRDRMAQHRRNPACTACHAAIDPLGFALENFDAVGRWREIDESYNPIDASGALPSGARFDSLSAFQTELLRRPEQFAATVTEKLLTYSLGRGLEAYDMPTVRSIVADTAAGHYQLSALI